jgi:hypothetical protein
MLIADTPHLVIPKFNKAAKGITLHIQLDLLPYLQPMLPWALGACRWAELGMCCGLVGVGMEN